MVKNSSENTNYQNVWKTNFKKNMEAFGNVAFQPRNSLFRLASFQNVLQTVIDSEVPNATLEEWYIGYVQRIEEIRNLRSQFENRNILFLILLVSFVLLMMSKPQEGKKTDRYIFIFDSIETYDAGDNTTRIAKYIETCHRFMTNVFQEMGLSGDFFTRFTFVTVLRTSTFMAFGSRQTSIWGNKRYIVQLKYYDFTIEAILKKMRFLRDKIPSAEKTELYLEMKRILSLLIPYSVIDDAINDGEAISGDQLRYFASKQYLPLFNNNFRTAVEYICRALESEEYGDRLCGLLDSLNEQKKPLYDYQLNGIRMIIIRYIFNEFKDLSYLSNMGFPSLHGTENHSMTRLLLEYLYWDEVKNTVIFPTRKYQGVRIKKLIDTFQYFCGERALTKILLDLSVYAGNSWERKDTIDNWANLIVYENSDLMLDEEQLHDVIVECLSRSEDLEKDDSDDVIDYKSIYVRLSAAGRCFSMYYLRNFEFLGARNELSADYPALFMLDEKRDIVKYILDIRTIIKNCIIRLLEGCESTCELYKGHQKNCIMRKKGKNSPQMLTCSLFIRYQECLDFIREAIDYIDRFRLVITKTNDSQAREINEAIVSLLVEFHSLYGYATEKLTKMDGRPKDIETFLSIWAYPENMQVNEQVRKAVSYEMVRPIQNYYAKAGENANKAKLLLLQNPEKGFFWAMEQSTEMSC